MNVLCLQKSVDQSPQAISFPFNSDHSVQIPTLLTLINFVGVLKNLNYLASKNGGTPDYPSGEVGQIETELLQIVQAETSSPTNPMSLEYVHSAFCR